MAIATKSYFPCNGNNRSFWHLAISKTESFVQWQQEGDMARGNSKKNQNFRAMATRAPYGRWQWQRSSEAWKRRPCSQCSDSSRTVARPAKYQAKALHWQVFGRSKRIPIFIKKQNVCSKACFFLLLCTLDSFHLLFLAQNHCDWWYFCAWCILSAL